MNRQLSSCPETPASGAPEFFPAVTNVLRETRSSGPLLVLCLIVMVLGALSSRAANAQTIINYPSGFAGATSGSAPIWLENASTLTGSSIQLTAVNGHSANNIWYKAPLDVQAFTTTFTWTATCPPSPASCGDGMGFMIISDPNSTPAGFTYSGFSGGQFSWSQCQANGVHCPAISSILVKFDLYNNETSAEGNFTGFYSGGEYPQAPNNPQYDMAPSGINMQSGHLMRATLAYNGTVLTETVTDTVTGATYTNSYTANIPSLVAGNHAYVGFGGGTGAATVTQNVQSWTYTVQSSGQAAIPAFSPAGGTYSASQSVSMSTASSGAVICYNTTGSPAPNRSNGCASGTLYTGPVTVSASETLYAAAGGSGYGNSPVAAASYVIQPPVAPPASSAIINYPSGFGSQPAALWLEDDAAYAGNSILVTDGKVHSANNVWFKTPVNEQAFTTTFTFHFDCSPSRSDCGDGMGFMMICACSGNPVWNPGDGKPGYTYSGFSSGQFSWSQCVAPYTGAGCPTYDSMLVKFDLYNNSTNQPGANITGYYTDGEYPQAPQNPQYDMSGSGINMQSGHEFSATLVYNGSTLVETLTDTVTGAQYTHTYTGVNIPGAIGANTAFVGFGGGTGAALVNGYLDSWTYVVQ